MTAPKKPAARELERSAQETCELYWAWVGVSGEDPAIEEPAYERFASSILALTGIVQRRVGKWIG